MTGTAPPLAADLTEGLRRLKLAAMRRLAPELLLTAKTQRWAPEELLRTLVEAEIAARDASNARTRLKNAAFPVSKTLEEFDLGVSSVPAATFAYLASLEWVTAAENLCLVGPAGTGKSHLLVALGAAAAGNTRLGPELAELNTLRAAHGDDAFADALGRAVAFSRWRAADVRSILAAGPGTADPRAAGDALVLELPVVPVRPLSDYAIGGLW